MAPVVRVVVVSRPGDGHGDSVCAELEERGALVWRISLNTYMTTSLAWELGQGLFVENEQGHLEVPFGAAAYYRRPGWAAPAVVDPHEAAALSEEADAQFFGLLEALDLRWLDSPPAVRRAELKLHQLQVARNIGLATPLSNLTNIRRTAERFASAGPTVVKAVGPGTIESPEGARPVHTAAFSGRDDLLRAVEICPVLLQSRLEVRTDVRITTVAGKAFVAVRPRSPDEPLDWREVDPEGKDFRVDSDPELSSHALSVAEHLGIRFSAQDWVVTDEGPVFLEANPAGQWLFLPDEIASAITSSIADALLAP